MHGLPKTITYEFLSHFWRPLWKRLDTALQYSITCHPQREGQTEDVNCTLGNLLQSLTKENPRQWDIAEPQGEFAYNNTPKRSSEKSPFKVVYHRPPQHVLDLVPLPKLLGISIIVDHMVDKFVNIYVDVKERLTESAAQYKAAVDKHRRAKSFNGGNMVMVHLRQERFPIRTYNRLKQKKIGPFQILR